MKTKTKTTLTFMLIAVMLSVFAGGCLEDAADQPVINASEQLAYDNNANLDAFSYHSEEIGGVTINQYASNNLTDQERNTYPLVISDNSVCGNQLSMAGTLTLGRFGDRTVPQYRADLTMQSNGQPVAYDRIRIDFDSGNVTAYTLMVTEGTNLTDGSVGRVLHPGEKDGIKVDTSNLLPRLLNLSSNGKLALHASVYNGNKIVGAFHATLPTPAEMSDGQAQLLFFRDFASVEKEIDKDFATRYLSYADPAEYQRRMEVMAQDTAKIDKVLPLTPPTIIKDDKVRITATAFHDIGPSGKEEYFVNVNTTTLQDVTYNVIDMIIDDGKTFYHSRMYTKDEYGLALKPFVSKTGDSSTSGFMTDAATQSYLANSPSGKIGAHIVVYNNEEVVACAHTVLPTIFVTAGQPAELPLGRSKLLTFDTYDQISKTIDPNYVPPV